MTGTEMCVHVHMCIYCTMFPAHASNHVSYGYEAAWRPFEQYCEGGIP